MKPHVTLDAGHTIRTVPVAPTCPAMPAGTVRDMATSKPPAIFTSVHEVRPDCHVVSAHVRSEHGGGVNIPVASCGSADAAAVVRAGLAMLAIANPLMIDALGSQSVPTEYKR